MWKFNDETPLFKQLVEQIRLKIINGSYKPGEKIPSVREFSVETKTNPNTVVKALSELENAGLIYTERTNGKFVTKDIEKIKHEKQEVIMFNMKQTFDKLFSLGITKEELIEYIKEMRNGDNNNF
ncbi:Transcriptional regulator, GntR family [Alteracholeplasma palmae J233]|uniref:Transcriptional regulator, GntR family n=1 Tax=Alteracholeplasma palmae (strain ATCC 49389 / J233) TaxID=1318466 RepID=U4KLA1_ALTPJ|nr:GntR family transcriptional regulator [Alteracholeplasma palmae]CCV64572.1 Transcriptional regulator, GntR family [Alteracholeplasma palmae J233]